jgi:small subunit ribosomal protein S1
VHLSDISWNQTGEEAIHNFKKGDEIETIVLSVDAERERISLGVKQLDQDPFSSFLSEHSKGSIVVGEISEVDARGAVVMLGDGVEGHIRASELDRERVEDARTVLKVGDKLEAKFVGVDRKKRTISLSVKAKDSDEEAAAVEEYSSSVAGVGATLGDIMKAQMETSDGDDGDDGDGAQDDDR